VQETRIMQTASCFRFGRLQGFLRVSSPFAHLSLPSNVRAHHISARTKEREREREGGEAGTGKGIRRENFANGRIIKGDSDHVSGTVRTVTSRAPSQWTPLVSMWLAGEQRCTRTRLSASYTSFGSS